MTVSFAKLRWCLVPLLTMGVAWSAPEKAVQQPLPPGTGFKHAIAMHGDPALPDAAQSLPYVNPDAPQGGELIIGEVGTFDSLNPYTVRGTPARSIAHSVDLATYVFETLMLRSMDEPFTLYGRVAEAIETPDDRTWVSFRLNPRAKFSDGSPITLDDVIATYEILRAKGRPNHRNFYGKVARIERLDDRTIRFVFGPDGNRELPLIMGLMPVLSAKWLAEHPIGDTWIVPPVASGPYRPSKIEPGRSVTFEKDPNWWGRDLPINRGLHNFGRVRIDFYREANAAFEAFKSGQYDIRRERDAKRWARGYRFRSLADGRVVKEDLPNGRASGLNALIFNVRRPPFDNADVRHALVLAFDFEWANQNLYAGQFRRINSMFDNSDLASTVYRAPVGGGPASMRPHFRKAIDLLAKAGFTAPQGRMVDAQGRPLSFEIINKDADLEKLLLLYQRNLSRLGVAMRIRTVDATQFAGLQNAFTYDVIPFIYDGTLSPGNEQSFRWGSKAADATGSFNLSGLKSAAADAMIETIAGARTREELRKAAAGLDDVVLNGHYALPLYYQPADYAARWRRIGRPEKTPVTGYRIETWWREKEESFNAKSLRR